MAIIISSPLRKGEAAEFELLAYVPGRDDLDQVPELEDPAVESARGLRHGRYLILPVSAGAHVYLFSEAVIYAVQYALVEAEGNPSSFAGEHPENTAHEIGRLVSECERLGGSFFIQH